MSAPCHLDQARTGNGGREFARQKGRHQSVVGRGRHHRRRLDRGEALTGIEGEKHVDSVVHRDGIGKMREDALFFFVETCGVLRNPLRWKQKQRLRTDVSFGARLLQDLLADFEAASEKRIGASPAVHHREAAQPFRVAHGELQSDDAADGMSCDVGSVDAGGIHHAGDIVSHPRDRSRCAGCVAAPGADLVIQDNSVAFAERR